MPLPGFTTTDGGLANTRFRAPVLSGSIHGNDPANIPLPSPAGFMCIQSTASLTNQVVTTSAVGLARASFMYIPVTTGNIIGAAAPPYVGVGTPIMWNDTLKTLAVWSSSAGSWMQQTSTVGGGYFTTS